MANNPNTPITELDFANIKTQLITFLQGQTQFKDFNYAGSNLNVILDVLAYNTFQNNFYTNMAISEMFLDSAQMRNSVISHAKELNYLPHSYVSANAFVRVTLNIPGQGAGVVIPKYTKFTTNYNGTNYTFITNQDYIARLTAGNTYVAENVQIYEGSILTKYEKDGFFIESNNLKCVLSNEKVDISSVKVFVNEETDEYIYTKDIFGVSPTDKVFYIEPYFDNKYTVVFGQNLFGIQPSSNDDIKISYRIANGSAANGAKYFSTSFANGALVETISAATGGAEPESIDDIKFFAPKSIQIQERAVTTKDYEILLKQKFPNEIQAISVYGGDELDPPQYGKVAISVNLINNTLLSDTKKNEYSKYLSDKTPVTIQTLFVNPEFMYVALEINAYYSIKSTNKSTQELESIIRSTISNYSTSNLDNFGVTLRMSRLSAAIDNSDVGILSNSIISRAIIEFNPTIGLPQNSTFNYASAIVKPYPYDKTNGFSNYYPSVVSSVFYYQGISALLQDDGLGNIQIVSSDNSNTQILNPSIGTIDYTNGIIRLVGLTVDSYQGTALQIFANILGKDIIAPQNRILYLRDKDININLIESL